MKKIYDIFIDNENVYHVRTKCEVVLIQFSDKEKEEIFKEILNIYENNEFYPYSHLKKLLVEKYQDDKVIDVIKELVQISLLNSRNFGIDNFQEDLRDTVVSNPGNNALKDKRLGYIGEGEMGLKIKEAVAFQGYPAFEILEAEDSLKEEDIEKLIANCDFFIVDLSLWSPYFVDFINKAALKLNKPWLLVEGLIDKSNFSIGPIFHGKETGCYDCYSCRLRSNDEFVSYTDAYEEYLRQGKRFAKPEPVSVLLKQYLSAIIVLDVSKYVGGCFIPETWRSVLIFNTESYDMQRHDFLKAPVCYTCKPELDYNLSPWFESVTLK